MSETPEPATRPVPSTPAATAPQPAAAPRERRSNRVVQAAAWVGIVAGTVFIVAVVFFSGFILGRHSDGGGRGWDGPRQHHEMMFRDGPPGPPMMGPGQGFGPGPGPGPQQQMPPQRPAQPTP